MITPAMAHAQVRAGSAYAYTVHDANGALLDGGKSYRLRVDRERPAKNFWSVDVYDNPDPLAARRPVDDLTRALEHLRPLAGERRRLVRPPVRADAPDGRESNWVETIPGKSWFVIFRLYGPLEP
jgi:hypothetical protein